jgi:ABC-2 type transport system permease protein
MGPLAALIRKEFIQFIRRKPLIILVIWTIAVEIAICAYSITYDVTNIPLAVRDLDRSPQSRELTSRFLQMPYFDLRYSPMTAEALDNLLDSGRAEMALVIPPDFSRDLAQRLPASVQLLVDGSNSNSALIALGYATRIIREYSRQLETERFHSVPGLPGFAPAVENQSRAWYNPALRSVDHEVIAMLTLAVMMIAIILPAAGLAWEKEAGTIEQLLVMPYRPWELMLAKVVPTFVVSLASLFLALWVPWWFAVPIRGSLALFFLLSALFLFTSLGLGLLIGTLSQNLQQALLLSFFSIFPILVISGTVVPVESMPYPVQMFSSLSPLTYYTEIALGIFLKGAGLDLLWPQALAMGALGIGIFALGIWRFGQTLGQ